MFNSLLYFRNVVLLQSVLKYEQRTSCDIMITDELPLIRVRNLVGRQSIRRTFERICQKYGTRATI